MNYNSVTIPHHKMLALLSNHLTIGVDALMSVVVNTPLCTLIITFTRNIPGSQITRL